MSGQKANLTETGLEIAVIGMAARFPGADTIDEFWDVIKEGKECLTYFTDEELEKAGVSKAIIDNPNYIKIQPIIKDVTMFDAAFFGYTPREAEIMDPQLRILHECAYNALEDAGYIPDSYQGLIGSYMAAKLNYPWINDLINTRRYNKSIYNLNLKNNTGFFSTTLSFNFNLKGPSYTIQCGCSSALVGVHQACQALLSGECDMAIAGGTKINMPVVNGYFYQEGMVSSRDGHARPFDAEASGAIFGSGAGVVVLKRLEYAIEDRDNIYAVIKSTAINNDGHEKISFTAPSIGGQSEVVKANLSISGIDPESITYIEAHATGTKLGDLAEVKALMDAFNTDKKQYCALGSVKANIGHLDGAAGIASFIKGVLVIRNRMLPPAVNFKTPNPEIDFDASPFYVNTELKPWKNDTYPLRAGVSSLGVGGTNAHLILEEAPAVEKKKASDRPHLLVLSARSRASLDMITDNYITYLENDNDSDIADMCYTLMVGRKAHMYRKHLVCTSKNDALTHLKALKDISAYKNPPDTIPEVFFLFGRDKPGIHPTATALYTSNTFFKDCVDECIDILEKETKTALKEKLLTDKQDSGGLLRFISEYALAKLLMHWEITPSYVTGNAAGELTAACIAGILELKTCLLLLYTMHQGTPITPEHVKGITPASPKILYIKGTTGTLADTFTADYFVTVLSDNASCARLNEELLPEDGIYLEISDAPALRAGIDDDRLITMGESIADLYDALGSLWTYGASFSSKTFYENEERYVLSLPGYAYERKEFQPQIDTTNMSMQHTVIGNTVVKSKDMSDWFFVPGWKNVVLPVKPPAKKYHYLIFLDDYHIGDDLQRLLQNKKHGVVLIKKGAKYQKEGLTYTIDVNNDTHYEQVFSDLKQNMVMYDRIVHLFGILPKKKKTLCTNRELKKALNNGYYSLLNIVKHAGRQMRKKQVHLFAVNNNMSDITGSEALYPEQGIIKGLLKQIPMEYPAINTTLIELDDADLKIEGLARTLQGEVEAPDSYDMIAYRNTHRWVETYEKVGLEDSTRGRVIIKPNGVYLITGGLGGIGLVIASELSKAYGAHFILTSRKVFPEKYRWVDYLKVNDVGDPVLATIKTIMTMEENGSQVLITKADVTSKTEMAVTMKNAVRKFGRIDGVIHAAGVSELLPIADKTREDSEKVFSPKLTGTLVLAEVFKNTNLDFMVFFSSLAAIVGNHGRSAYSAANSFMDTFAYYMQRNGAARTVSINWDGWQDTGMSKRIARQIQDDTITPPPVGDDGGGNIILASEGPEAFYRALGCRSPQIIVSTGDLPTRIQILKNLISRLQDGKGRKKSVDRARPELSTDFVAPETPNQIKMAKIWDEFFGINGLGIEDNFFEIGGDSLDAVLIMSIINEDFRTRIPLPYLFTRKTITGLTELLEVEKESAEPYSVKPVVILNDHAKHKVFCMPIRNEHSVIQFTYMAEYVRDYAVVTLEDVGTNAEYNTNDEIMDRYVELITTTQPEGPYILMGKCYGGLMAFFIARELEKRGYEVSDLIIVDTFLYETVDFNYMGQDIRYQEATEYVPYLRFLESVRQSGLLKTILRPFFLAYKAVYDYITYRQGEKVRSDYQFNADIHFIRSPGARHGFDKYLMLPWKRATKKNFYQYDGFGGHHEMFTKEYVEQNAGVVKKILDTIYSGK